MNKGVNNQRKFLLVNFPDGATQPALAVNSGVPVPMFRDLKNKMPLVIAWVTVVQALLVVSGYLILDKEQATDTLPDGSNNEFEMFWNTRRILAFGNSMCFSTIFLAFTGLASMMLWEMNVVKRASHLSFEMGLHRMIRLALLIFVVALGLFNTVHCGNLYTLFFEMVLIFIFFVAECSYHLLLLIYIRMFNRYAMQQRKQSKQFFKESSAKNPNPEKMVTDLKHIQVQPV